MDIIQIKNLCFSYKIYNEEEEKHIEHKVLNDISLNIKKGSFVAILGHNGSGKSTLAKHINGIYKSDTGDVFIDEMNTKDEKNIWNIRKNVGMVFQNPDNQLVATIVKDDVAFGVENLGIEREEMKKRIEYALKCVNMHHLRNESVSTLSGGQKQRVAIAGILAIEPKCIVLDEPTAMLDPKGRKEVLETVKKLNKEKGITIILITHYMEETIDADRLIVMENGKIVLDNTPLNVFKNVEKIKKMKLNVPHTVDIMHNLAKLGHSVNIDCLSIENFSKNMVDIGFKQEIYKENINHKTNNNNEEKIYLKKISHIYAKDTVFEKKALKNINLVINKGDFFGIIGHTGSGKSTLIQIFNALIQPTLGKVYINRENIYENKTPLKNIRQKIGVVFQYPEYQLFEETVYKDVAFAPTNMRLSAEEIDKRVVKALDIVGIDKTYYKKSPFELSGGEKRRVAVAGVLAMEPDVLVFDELTAGLDPYNRVQILERIQKMQSDFDKTIVLVSHSMDDVAEVCNKVLVLYNGEIKFIDSIEEVFKNSDILEKIGLEIPKCSKIFHTINKYGYKFQTDVYTSSDCIKILHNSLKK